MAWAAPVNIDCYKYFSAQFGFRPFSTNLGEVLSLDGYYKNYYCHIKFPLILGDTGPQLAYAIFHLNLNHRHDNHLRINPREYIHSSKDHCGNGTKTVSGQNRSGPAHDVLLDLIKHEKQGSFALYLIEIQENKLLGYMGITQSDNEHVISSLNFLVNFAHKLDWIIKTNQIVD